MCIVIPQAARVRTTAPARQSGGKALKRFPAEPTFAGPPCSLACGKDSKRGLYMDPSLAVPSCVTSGNLLFLSFSYLVYQVNWITLPHYRFVILLIAKQWKVSHVISGEFEEGAEESLPTSKELGWGEANKMSGMRSHRKPNSYSNLLGDGASGLIWPFPCSLPLLIPNTSRSTASQGKCRALALRIITYHQTIFVCQFISFHSVIAVSSESTE